MARGLQAPRVEGWLAGAWERQVEPQRHYVGRGRGSAKRAPPVREHRRDHRTRLAREEDPSATRTARFGGTAFGANATHQRLALAEAVLCSRNADRSERIVNRLKSRGHIAPRGVTRDDQSEGRPSLLTLGVRVGTVRAFGLRRSLQNAPPPPRLTPGKREKDDQHANGGAEPESVSGGVTAHPPDRDWGGKPAGRDALIGVAAGHPVSPRLGTVSVSTA